MPVLKGIDRDQITFSSLEEVVAADSEVRLIDVFIDQTDLSSLALKEKGVSKEGRSAFSNSALLKLYLYAYLNRTRSSRRIEKLCKLNIEVQWLLKGLKPCYVTIANFRKDNPKALGQLFKCFVRFLGQPILGLFDKNTVGIDGSYFSGQNSKSNNYTRKKIDRELKHIEKKVAAYLAELDELDAEELADYNEERRIEIAAKFEHLKKRSEKYEGLSEQMVLAQQQGQTQISTTDVDARYLAKHNISQVGVNLLATAEAKNKFFIEMDVLNESDRNALSKSSLEAKEILGIENQGEQAEAKNVGEQNNEGEQVANKDVAEQNNEGGQVAAKDAEQQNNDGLPKNTKEEQGEFNQEESNEAAKLRVLADAGFDTGSELKKCIDNGIETYVAPRKGNNGSKAYPYRNEDFDYDEDQDRYDCPAGEHLVSNGKEYTKKPGKAGGNSYQFKKYIQSFLVCGNCPFHKKCLSASSIKINQGRIIERSEYQDYKDENKERVKWHKDLYKKRQEIIEHQFGTIKRGWGYSYTLLKGLPKIKGEFSLILTVYNLRRAITILGVKKLIELLKAGSISNNNEYIRHFKPDSGVKIFCIGSQLNYKTANIEAQKPAMAA